MGEVKMYRPLTDEVVDLGLPEQDDDALLGIGEALATFDPGVVVFTQGMSLQQWKAEEEDA